MGSSALFDRVELPFYIGSSTYIHCSKAVYQQAKNRREEAEHPSLRGVIPFIRNNYEVNSE